MEFMPAPQTDAEKERDEQYAAQKRAIDKAADEDWYARLHSETSLTIEGCLIANGWYRDENLILREPGPTGFVPV